MSLVRTIAMLLCGLVFGGGCLFKPIPNPPVAAAPEDRNDTDRSASDAGAASDSAGSFMNNPGAPDAAASPDATGEPRESCTDHVATPPSDASVDCMDPTQSEAGADARPGVGLVLPDASFGVFSPFGSR